MFDKTLKIIFLLLSISYLGIACSPQKVRIDRAAEAKIIWPGPPEIPRISYLWSISDVSISGGSGLGDFLTGSPNADMTDPSSSPRLLRPFGVFADDTGMVYITDPGAFRVTVINMKDETSRQIFEAGKAEFVSPVGVAAFEGNIYVSDAVLNKVFIFNADGKFQGEFEGVFERPTMLALDRNKRIVYLSDTGAHTIYRYSPEGKRLGSFGRRGEGNGEFNFPTHLWVDKAGRLYVTDSLNFRVQIFSPDGAYESGFGRIGDSYHDLEKPKGLATDSDGNIYIVDAMQDTVKIFSRNGDLLLFFGRQGADFGEFWLPSGFFVDAEDKIYVADTYNGRVQVFQYLKKRH